MGTEPALTDAELLARLLDDDRLTASEREAFVEMRERGDPLSRKQRAWARSVAGRLTPVKNTFSSLSERERAAQLGQVLTLLPWEKTGYRKALKPPGR
jgi:hypothetical protein